MQDLSRLQHWLEKYGNQVTVLQLHECRGAALTALPCCAKLQDLLLHGLFAMSGLDVGIASRMWSDIASATKLTSVSLSNVKTSSQQADVVAALTALPNLEQLTWRYVNCSNQLQLSDSSLLQQMTRLTCLDLQCITAAALQHLGSLTKLQHLSISIADDWAAAGCPGLQELQALTSLKLAISALEDLPAGVRQLAALRQLDIHRATPTALNRLQVLTGLTQLRVRQVTGLSPESPPLKLPGLQHLELEKGCGYIPMPMTFLSSCTQLRFLKLRSWALKGPGSLVASTMLQHLELQHCSISAAGGAADPVSWQQVFPSPGRLPHITSMQLLNEKPALQQADIKAVVACCSNLKVLDIGTLQDSFVPPLARLSGLTSLNLYRANDEDCSAMVQLTGLRQLKVTFPHRVSAVGFRQLAALNQLTSLGLGCSQFIVAQYLMKDYMPDCSYAIIDKAPSGCPPDVSSRLLAICDVVDACEGLSMDAVIAAAERELKPSGFPGPSDDVRSKPLTAEGLLAAAAALKAQGD